MQRTAVIVNYGHHADLLQPEL